MPLKLGKAACILDDKSTLLKQCYWMWETACRKPKYNSVGEILELNKTSNKRNARWRTTSEAAARGKGALRQESGSYSD